MTMKEYRNTKLEYYGSEMTAFQTYGNFLLPIYLVFSNINLLWNITVAGYPDIQAFLMDFCAMVLAFLAFISLNLVDGHSFVANLAFLAYMATTTIISAKRQLSMPAADNPGLGESLAVMGSMETAGDMGMMGEAMAVGEAGAFAGMGTAEMMNPEAVSGPAPLASFGEMLKNKLLQSEVFGSLAANEQMLTFFIVLLCEICLVGCLFYMVYFISHHKLFFSSLHSLAGNEQML